MKNKIVSFILMLLALIEIILMKNFSVTTIFFNSMFFVFFLSLFITSLFDKKNKFGEKYLLFVILMKIIFSIVSCFTDSISLGLYSLVLGIMSFYLFNKIFKEDKSVNKLLITVYILECIPLLLGNFNLIDIYSIIFRFLIVIYLLWQLWEKRTFKWYEWRKYILIVVIAIIYMFYPILGGILALLMGVLNLVGLFEILNKRKEDAIYNKRVRSNEIFIYTKKLYNYVPNNNDFFQKQLEDVGKRTFLTEEIPYELYAIMDVIEYRKNENLTKIVYENKADLMQRVGKLIDANIRPELVCYMLMMGFKERTDIKDSNKEKIYQKIEKVMFSFDEKVMELVEDNNVELMDKLDNAKTLYNKFSDEMMKLLEKTVK